MLLLKEFINSNNRKYSNFNLISNPYIYFTEFKLPPTVA